MERVKTGIRKVMKRTIFHYIIAFSAIIVLIIALMGGYLYRQSSQTIYKDFLASNRSEVSSFYNRNEGNMKIINNITTQMGMSKDITRFYLEHQPVKSIHLKERLQQYSTVNDFFVDAYYVYHNDHYLYNSNTSVSEEQFLDIGFSLGNTGKEQMQEYFLEKTTRQLVLPEQEIGGYLVRQFTNDMIKAVVVISPILGDSSSSMFFIVPDVYFDALLYSETESQRQNCILYENQVIAERGSLLIEQDKLTELVQSLEAEAIVGKDAKQKDDAGEKMLQKVVSVENEKYLLSVKQGESGLKYCTVQPMSVYHDKIFHEQWGILFLLLICSIPTALLITYLSKGLAGTVRDINSMLHDNAEASYDLAGIETGIRMLVESSQKAEKESTTLRKTRFVSSFVREEYPDKETVLQEAKKAGFELEKKKFLVVLMGDRENSNETKAHKMMLKEIAEAEGVDGYGIHLINKSQSLFVLFAKEEEQMEMLLTALFSIGKQFCQEFIMATSDYHEDLFQADEAYLEADAAFDSRLLVDTSHIIRFVSVAERETVVHLPDNYLKQLKNAIRIGNEKEVQWIIQEICKKLKEENQSLLTFRLLYNDLIHMLITEGKKNPADYQRIYSVFTLSQCLTIQDFSDILLEVCHMLMEGDSKEKESKSDMITEAVSYMKEHYMEPELNMTSLAEYLSVSPVTLAVDFKNGMGMSPSDYLAIIRMECAKSLLKETDMKVKEVSLAVGYEDDHVFMRRFKKYTGKTPGQYRSENE